MELWGGARSGAGIGASSPGAVVGAVARWWPLAVVAALALLWAKTVQTVYVNEGPFVWLGVDFRAYYTQALALRQGGPADLYNLALAGEITRLFDAYSRVPWPLPPSSVPYPPIFAGLFLPLT